MKNPTTGFALNIDRASAVLNISGRFDVEELEELMCRLGALRAEMDPEVTEDATQAAFDSSCAQLQPEPNLAIVGTDAGVCLWVRNRCFGWLAFGFSKADAQALGNCLERAASGETPRGEIIPFKPLG